MPISEAKKRADAKYAAKHFKTLGCRTKIEDAKAIQDHAAKRGETINAFLLRAIKETIERDKASSNS